MRVSTANSSAKISVTNRIPENLTTVRLISQRNRGDWEEFSRTENAQDRKGLENTMLQRRRRRAPLLEELTLRTSRVRPMMIRLENIFEFVSPMICRP